MGHLRLPAVKRTKIAGQISQGITFQRILDNTRSRDSVSTKFDQIHLITRKDIANIEREFGLKCVEKHSDDATSLLLWVEEMKSRGSDNPVLVYKRQGEQPPMGCDYLEIDDFVLIIQTELQKQMMKEFGKRVVCIDSTHKTTGYDFLLITVMVVDEFGEGYPVAWCLCNREDQILMTIFMKQLHTRVGNLIPEWFMSDDAHQFFNSWTAVFGRGPKKLLCTWHVDRAWRQALGLIHDRENKCTVYYTLRMLLDEASTERFCSLLDATLAQFEVCGETYAFAQYFRK